MRYGYDKIYLYIYIENSSNAVGYIDIYMKYQPDNLKVAFPISLPISNIDGIAKVIATKINKYLESH
jgi:hypothetical protein